MYFPKKSKEHHPFFHCNCYWKFLHPVDHLATSSPACKPPLRSPYILKKQACMTGLFFSPVLRIQINLLPASILPGHRWRAAFHMQKEDIKSTKCTSIFALATKKPHKQVKGAPPPSQSIIAIYCRSQCSVSVQAPRSLSVGLEHPIVANGY